MTQVVQAKCPFCQNVLRIPADWLNQAMRCKFCKQVIQARGPLSGAPAPAPAPAVAISSAEEAQAAFAAPAVAVASAPLAKARTAGDPFTFDAGHEPAPVATGPYRRKKGKGLLIATMLLLSLTTVAVLMIIFLGPQLRDLFAGKVRENPVAQNGDKGAPPEAGDKTPSTTDKSNADKSKKTKNPTPVTDKTGDKTPETDKTPEADKNSVAQTDKSKTPEMDKRPVVPKSDGVKPPEKKPGPNKTPKNQELFPRRALLINVNNYWLLNSVHYGSAQSAGYPGSSTSVLASRMSNAPMYFPATQVAELSDSAASPVVPQKAVIEEAISQFCNTSREQDRLVLIFAGHAIDIEKEAYLIPYEGLKDDPKTLIPLSWVYDKLAKCKARQKIFVLDAFRDPTARGFELPGTGAMSEDFEAKLHNPPPGVQVWSACVKDQSSIEFDRGSIFMQSLCNALQERLGGFASPQDEIPVEALLPKVNQRMKELLSKTKREQVSRLSGKESEGGAAYNAAEALPPQLAFRAHAGPTGEDKASGALVNNIMGEMKQIPPMKSSLRAYMSTLRAESMPPFHKKVMDFYTAEYKSWAEMEAMLKKMPGKYPLREAVLEAKKALDKAEGLTMRESLTGPISDKTKAAFLKEQQEPALFIFDLEEALAKMKEADEMRDKEDSKRWQANFDYTMARLLARLVYVDEYNFILADIRGDRLPALEGDDTLWRLGFQQKLSTTESKTKNRAKEINKLWKKITQEHPSTPWALMAQRESLYAMGLKWNASRD